MTQRPDTTIGPNCGYEVLRGKQIEILPSMYEYVTNCAYGVCKADCCQRGCWVSDSRRDKIAQHWDGIVPFLEDNVGKDINDHIVPMESANDPKSHNYDPIYEGMHVNSSNMVRRQKGAWNNGYCTMLTKKHDGIIGCSIHKYLHESGAGDWHEIKPLGCILFPARAKLSRTGTVTLGRRNWGDAPCCQKVTKPGDGPRAIDVQLTSIASLFDIDEERMQAIIDWFEPSDAKRIREEYEAQNGKEVMDPQANLAFIASLDESMKNIVTKEQYLEVCGAIQLIELANAQGRDTPQTDARLEELYLMLDKCPRIVDPDSGEFVLKEDLIPTNK